MRTSQISLLFLAASAAAPVFAAPLPYVIIFAAVVTPLTCQFSTVTQMRALMVQAMS